MENMIRSKCKEEEISRRKRIIKKYQEEEERISRNIKKYQEEEGYGVRECLSRELTERGLEMQMARAATTSPALAATWSGGSSSPPPPFPPPDFLRWPPISLLSLELWARRKQETN